MRAYGYPLHCGDQRRSASADELEAVDLAMGDINADFQSYVRECVMQQAAALRSAPPKHRVCFMDAYALLITCAPDDRELSDDMLQHAALATGGRTWSAGRAEYFV